MMVAASGLRLLLQDSLTVRRELVTSLHAEGTSCYRLLHGATEGAPGVTLDRYGDLLLLQTFRDPPADPAAFLHEAQALVGESLGLELHPMWHDRRKGARQWPMQPPSLAVEHSAAEIGLDYLISIPNPGKDPGLFLDFRVARRWLRKNSNGRDVLNVFSYTCGAGVAALAGGAKSVVNLDFSESALCIGTANAELNGLDMERWEAVRADALPALRALGGLPAAQDRRRRGGVQGRGRGGQRGRTAAAPQPKLRPRQFDLVVLDPPTWSTSTFGTVDIVRDYQSLFKPACLATRPGGTVLATNHVSTVDEAEWHDSLARCAAKAGRPLVDIQTLSPEHDFPMLVDGRSPLKLALAIVG